MLPSLICRAASHAAIVIGGGVGPAAGVALHQSIIEHTRARGDGDHLHVHHVSHSAMVRDRTEFLLGAEDARAGERPANPGTGMVKALTPTLHALAAAHPGLRVAVGVPCNTFHAPAVFDEFRRAVDELRLDVTVVDMLAETRASLEALRHGGGGNVVRTVGVMATTGTRRAGTYRDLLEPAGFQVVEVAEADQPALHASIYDARWGLKAVFPATARAKENFAGYAAGLVAAGADALVLGCTEIPLAFPRAPAGGVGRFGGGEGGGAVPLVDPVACLARALVRKTDASKLIADDGNTASPQVRSKQGVGSTPL